MERETDQSTSKITMGKDFYADIAAAAAANGGTYVNDGIYKFMIEKMFRHDSNAPGGGTSFITELKVIESTVHPSHPDVKPNPVGSTCSVVCNVTKHASAFGNVKALLLGALGAFGYTEDMITPEVVQSAFTSEQLIGIMLEDATYRKEIRSGANAGKPITLHKWTSIEQSEEDVATQKSDLRAGKYSVKASAPAALLRPTETKTEEKTEAAPAVPAKKASLLTRPGK